ncbi:hypothetical protein TEA_029909 [Camellia sinensis var. sinensis]|uniref:Protein LOW PSII ACCUMULATION 1, chloroplastic n=1 Tax=Camellia sinensis var. sinensis TaxID=542762 RepID=A0A4S4EHJ3_CAMSN|nr:hypothetical protein TEA_029909 [Camellia sinensis var. sinensis]
MMQLSSYVIGCCSNLHPNYNNYSFWFSTSRPIRYSDATPFLLPRTARQPPPPPYAAVTCSAANKPSSSTQVRTGESAAVQWADSAGAAHHNINITRSSGAPPPTPPIALPPLSGYSTAIATATAIAITITIAIATHTVPSLLSLSLAYYLKIHVLGNIALTYSFMVSPQDHTPTSHHYNIAWLPLQNQPVTKVVELTTSGVKIDDICRFFKFHCAANCSNLIVVAGFGDVCRHSFGAISYGETKCSTAKIRSEVLSPFRSVRMFFYLAFIASATIGGLIATNQLIAALANSSKAAQVPDILMGLGIDVGAVSIFAFLYSRENNAKNVQLARLSREENLSNLKLSVNKKKVIPVSDLRGIARLVILAGPASFISECFRLSEPYTEGLLERGVLVVPFATDGNSPSFEFEESEEMKEVTRKRKMLWQLVPVYATNWSEWLDEQKKLAKVSPESPVYLSLRMDGRVRGSGVGYPPWNAFVAQLPPVKGMWSGLFDGMDGRVL